MNPDSPSSSLLRVLHLEDSPDDSELIQALLAQEWSDCRMQRVETRADFIAALQGTEFDLILSDSSLPGFDGWAALEMLRSRGSATPFLFLSGYADEAMVAKARERGAADYLIKDRPEQIVPAVRRALGGASERRDDGQH